MATRLVSVFCCFTVILTAHGAPSVPITSGFSEGNSTPWDDAVHFLSEVKKVLETEIGTLNEILLESEILGKEAQADGTFGYGTSPSHDAVAETTTVKSAYSLPEADAPQSDGYGVHTETTVIPEILTVYNDVVQKTSTVPSYEIPTETVVPHADVPQTTLIPSQYQFPAADEPVTTTETTTTTTPTTSTTTTTTTTSTTTYRTTVSQKPTPFYWDTTKPPRETTTPEIASDRTNAYEVPVESTTVVYVPVFSDAPVTTKVVRKTTVVSPYGTLAETVAPSHDDSKEVTAPVILYGVPIGFDIPTVVFPTKTLPSLDEVVGSTARTTNTIKQAHGSSPERDVARVPDVKSKYVLNEAAAKKYWSRWIHDHPQVPQQDRLDKSENFKSGYSEQNSSPY